MYRRFVIIEFMLSHPHLLISDLSKRLGMNKEDLYIFLIQLDSDIEGSLINTDRNLQRNTTRSLLKPRINFYIKINPEIDYGFYYRSQYL